MVSAEPAAFEESWPILSSRKPDGVEANHETPKQVHCVGETRAVDQNGVATVAGITTVCSDAQQRHEATRSQAARADNLLACDWGGAVW